MPRPPQYRVHAAKNLAYVTLGGRMIYLGRAHSPESREQFHALLAAHYAGEPAPTRRDRRTPSALTVAELAERWYLAECERRGPRP